MVRFVSCVVSGADRIFLVVVSCSTATILIIGDLAAGGGSPDGSLYPDNGGTACLRDPGTPGVGSTWWAMMNGSNVYDDQTPSLTPIKTSPSSTPVTTSSASSTSPVTSQSGPLHIPAKRLGYECMEPTSGVIRHHPGSQPWNYTTAVDGHHPSTPFDQYSQPTYYNLPDSRGDRKLFWNPASTAQEYKAYSTSVTPGTSADPAVSTCHQTGFSPNTWCNYPYASSRHHVDAHHQSTVPYLSSPGDERRVMVDTAPPFGHETAYTIRNYPSSDTVPSTPYPPSGKQKNIQNFHTSACQIWANCS